MGKKMCERKKKTKNDKNKKYFCKSCKMQSDDKENLCKPEKS